MKKLLIIMAVCIAMVACGSNGELPAEDAAFVEHLRLDNERQLEVVHYAQDDSLHQPLWDQDMAADAIVIYERYGLICGSFRNRSERLYFQSHYGRNYFAIQHSYSKSGNAQAAADQLYLLMLTAHESFGQLGVVSRNAGALGAQVDALVGDLYQFFAGVSDGGWGRFTGISHRWIVRMLSKGTTPRRLLIWLFVFGLLLSSSCYIYSPRLARRGMMTPLVANLIGNAVHLLLVLIPFLIVGGELASMYGRPDMTMVLNLERCYGIDTQGLVGVFDGYSYLSGLWLVVPILLVMVLGFYADVEVRTMVIAREPTEELRQKKMEQLQEEGEEALKKAFESLLALLASAILPFDFVLFILFSLALRMLMPILDLGLMKQQQKKVQAAQRAKAQTEKAPRAQTKTQTETAPRPKTQTATPSAQPLLPQEKALILPIYERVHACSGGKLATSDNGNFGVQTWDDGSVTIGKTFAGNFCGPAILIAQKGGSLVNMPRSAFFLGSMSNGLMSGERCATYDAQGQLKYLGPIKSCQPARQYPTVGLDNYSLEISFAGEAGHEYGYLCELHNGQREGWGMTLYANGMLIFGRFSEGQFSPGSECLMIHEGKLTTGFLDNGKFLMS